MTPQELADRLEAAAAKVGPAVARTVTHEGQMLRALIQNNASGRPGPNIITGAYVASWRVVTRKLAHGADVTVGTEKPQGRRLEYGFVGTDSIGRTYNQPPYPHVGPAVTDLSPRFASMFRRAVEEALS